MQEVHIYIYAEKAPLKESKKWYGYVLECEVSGQSVTRASFGAVTATHNGATIWAMVRAMERLTRTCEVHLHAENEFVLNMLENQLENWAGNDWRTSRGEEVANRTAWEQIRRLSQTHLILSEPGGHAYGGWLQAEVKRRKEQGNV